MWVKAYRVLMMDIQSKRFLAINVPWFVGVCSVFWVALSGYYELLKLVF